MNYSDEEPLARTLKTRRPEPRSPMLGALAELPEAILICSAVAGNLTVTFANPACHALLGLTRDARLDGEPLVILLGAWLTETAQDSLRRAILLRRSFTLPLERVDQDGARRRAQLSLRVTAQDSAALWVGVLKPVASSPALAIERATLISTGTPEDSRLSRRLRSEPGLSGLLMDALDATPAYVGIRTRGGHYEYANGPLAEFFGLTPAALLAARGSAVEARIAGPDEWTGIARRVLDAGESVAWRDRLVVDALGRERLLDVFFSPLGALPGPGDLVLEVATEAAALRAVGLNRADHAHAEAAAAAEQRNARALFAALPVMLLTVDTEGTIIDVNAAWLETLGCLRSDVLQQPLSRFVQPGGGGSPAAGSLWPLLQDGLRGLPCVLRCPDGRPLDSDLSVFVARDQHGGASGATLCFRQR